MAENNSGIKIRRAFISIGGVTLRGDTASGVAIISKADGEVTSLDINKALQDCEDNLNLNNKKVIKVIPTSFKLDAKEILGRPEGMRGTKLEIKALFITCAISHFEDLLEVITLAGIEPIDIMAAPLAGSFIAMSPKQKMVGGALVNIGSETTSLSVYENALIAATFSANLAGAAAARWAVSVLERTGLAKKRSAIAGRLPLLERKRLELARAIAARPKLLMLDEIAGGLTEPEVHELVSLIRELKADHSIIWIEHIAHALTATADTLMVLHFGAKIAEGEPHAILRSPEVRQIYLGIAADAAP